MRVLFADTLPESCVDEARRAGFDCVVDPSLQASDLPAAIGGHDVLVVRSTKVSAETIAAADRLGLIIRAGAGTNTIDVEAAAAAAVQVTNVPGENAVAVAELTIGLMLAIDRRIADSVIDSRAGHWDKKKYSQGRGLFGRTLGIVGLGAIGVEVARRARAFGMEVVVRAASHSNEERRRLVDELGLREVPSLDELAAESEFITIHVPAAPETKGLLGPDLLSHVQDGAVIINTSRGDTIDEQALLAAVEERQLWVGLDVYPHEPAEGTAEFVSALATHPRVYGTHHIGASTQQAQQAVGDRVLEILDVFRQGGDLTTAVNFAEVGSDHTTLVIRHLNRVGVLSSILAAIRGAGINVEDMTNRIFAGGNAALATIHVAGRAADGLADDLERLEHVVAVSVLE